MILGMHVGVARVDEGEAHVRVAPLRCQVEGSSS